MSSQIVADHAVIERDASLVKSFPSFSMSLFFHPRESIDTCPPLHGVTLRKVHFSSIDESQSDLLRKNTTEIAITITIHFHGSDVWFFGVR